MANLPECDEENSGTYTSCQVCFCYDKKPNILQPYTRRICQYFSYESLHPCATCTTAGEQSIIVSATKPCQTCAEENGFNSDGVPYGKATWTQNMGLDISCRQCRNVGGQEEYVYACDDDKEYCNAGKCTPDCPEYCDPFKCQVCEYLDANREKIGCVNSCTDLRKICYGKECICSTVPFNDGLRNSPGFTECPRSRPSVDGDCNCICDVQSEQCAADQKFDADNCRCIRDITYSASQAVIDGLVP
tara:strand:+ start:4470 stop:5207 length:738 start_codon:yes stop_codon:yes gene_type:complete